MLFLPLTTNLLFSGHFINKFVLSSEGEVSHTFSAY